MSPLLHCQDISKSYGSKNLFSDLSISIFPKDRIGLIGPNGSGKSTLLKILAGIENPGSGQISKNRGLKIGYVPQKFIFPDKPIEEILYSVIKNQPGSMDYENDVLVQTWLSKLGFENFRVSAALLSGGWQKRLSIAKELILKPDVLLLDEPTNHLDLEGVLWLEKFLANEPLTFLLISHDRQFLQNTTTKIIEVNASYPNGIFSVNAAYDTFLVHKEAFLKGQLETERSLASKARREKEWLNKTPQARSTKSRARIDEAYELFDELSQVKQRNKVQRVDIDFNATKRETKKLLTAKNIKKDLGGGPLFEHLDFTLSPGSRMGLMGFNGSGKTTLLRLLTDEIQPDEGTIKKADKLKIVYFDQHRAQLPDHITLREALAPNGDHVTYQNRSIHVNGWCQRFLFSPHLLDLPISHLSGGERARIAIANLMLEPADLLLLDEPTNDLDIDTLEILEESLLEFPGAVVLITHDRYMLDRIGNTFLALGNIHLQRVFSSYSQWEAAAFLSSENTKLKKEKVKNKSSNKPNLTYEEKKEYRAIEKRIGKIEEQIASLNEELEISSVKENVAKLQEVCSSIGEKEAELNQLFDRWVELEAKLKSV